MDSPFGRLHVHLYQKDSNMFRPFEKHQMLQERIRYEMGGGSGASISILTTSGGGSTSGRMGDEGISGGGESSIGTTTQARVYRYRRQVVQ